MTQNFQSIIFLAHFTYKITRSTSKVAQAIVKLIIHARTHLSIVSTYGEAQSANMYRRENIRERFDDHISKY